MIPVADIIPENLYSQDDAPFLLGEGFTPKAAREAISSACRKGVIESQQWRRRYWFTGRAFLAWLKHTGLPVGSDSTPSSLAPAAAARQDPARRPGDRSPSLGREVSK